jgi:hypothetical protein
MAVDIGVDRARLGVDRDGTRLAVGESKGYRKARSRVPVNVIRTGLRPAQGHAEGYDPAPSQMGPHYPVRRVVFSFAVNNAVEFEAPQHIGHFRLKISRFKIQSGV